MASEVRAVVNLTDDEEEIGLKKKSLRRACGLGLAMMAIGKGFVLER